VYSKRQGLGGGSPMGIHFLAWGPVALAPATRRGAYTLAFTVFERVHVAHLEFDFRVMRYVATASPAQLPATGFSRAYTCGAMDAGGRMLLAGTAAGELAVYSLVAAGVPLGAPSPLQPAPIFKTALVASSNGVHAVCCARVPPGGGGGGGGAAVFVGGGDGLLRCFVGRDAEWVCTGEARVPARIISVAVSASNQWLLVGTAAGSLYRVAWLAAGAAGPVSLAGGVPPPARGAPPLAAFVDLLESSHTGAIAAVGFHGGSSEACATVSADASVRVWNLNDYRCSWTLAGAAGAPPTCLWVAPGAGGGAAGGAGGGAPPPPGLPLELFVGFADGGLRCYGVRGGGEEVGSAAGGRAPSEAWRANAHRGAVTAISGNRAVVVTGGADGRVNVWSRASHELLLSFSDHSRPVVGVAVDPRSPEVVYSAGADRLLVAYNLRAERRVRSFSLPTADTHACTVTALAQLAHGASERELLAATSDGRIFVFDPDVSDTHAGAVDVLVLLAEHRLRLGAGAAAAGVPLPAAKPGQARPELRITALAPSPSNRFLAVGTACGRLCVLVIPALSGVGGGGGAAGAGVGTAAAAPPAAGAAAALQRRGPVNAGTFTDLSGTVRPALVSQAAVMRLMAVFYGRACYADVRWTPDERQIVAVGDDACLSVFNFYGP
jgi:hypothetical protein